jgi:hypothetical protein
VKRAFASIAGLVGIAALGRWFASRRQRDESAGPPVEAVPVDATPVDGALAGTAPAETAPDPAEELRRKLADARVTEPESAPMTEQPVQPEETLEGRRARVHAKAREAIDSMGTDSTGDGGASA